MPQTKQQAEQNRRQQKPALGRLFLSLVEPGYAPGKAGLQSCVFRRAHKTYIYYIENLSLLPGDKAKLSQALCCIGVRNG